MFHWFKNRRRRKIIAEAWPADWNLFLNRNVRLSWNLTEIQNTKLRECARVFIAEKDWEGCNGLVVTDEMRVTIAGQACLMLLGSNGFYFDNVKTILIYPQAFTRNTSEGMLHGSTQHRAGEAWQGGPVVLSWHDVLRGGRNDDDGSNVVIHEFAHALDGLDGEMGGSLMFDDPETSDQWTEVVEREFKELCNAKELGRDSLLDHYGATNRAEFFAVAAETFFERSVDLKIEHPELFDLLERYFKFDPTIW